MIGTIKFWNAANDVAATGTSGYSDNFIENLNLVQVQLRNTLLPHYEKNQTVKDIFKKFVKPVTKATIAGTGLLTLESDYVQFGSVGLVSGCPAYPINNNEVSIIESSPIRKPGVATKNIFYYQKDDQTYFLPKDVSLTVPYTYIRKPVDAALVLTPADTDELDYLVPSGAVDMEWPESMFNLLLYMYLDKLGMEMKEPIILEYANLGIAREMINVEPQ